MPFILSISLGSPQDRLPEVTAAFLRDVFPFHAVFRDVPDLFDWGRPVETLWDTAEVRRLPTPHSPILVGPGSRQRHG